MKNTHDRSGQDLNPKKTTTIPKSSAPKKEESNESDYKISPRWEESDYILPISDNRRKLSRDEFLYDDEEE